MPRPAHTLLVLLAPLLLAATPSPLQPIIDALDGEVMKAHAEVLASPAYRGRMSGEPELYNAAAYVEERWRQWGIAPLGPEGSYQQEFRFDSSRTMGASTVTLFPDSGDPITYTETDDYHPFPYGGSTPVEGPVAFVGYGISAPDLGYDDYANFDATGKIVVVMRHAPNHEMEKFGDHATFITKAQTARDHGAVGMVLVTDPNDHDTFAPLDFPSANLNLGEGFAAVFLHTRFANQWIEGSGQPLTALQAAIDESGTPMSFDLSHRAALTVPVAFEEDKPSVNVIGYLPGRDPRLKNEIVVIGAHLDHLGYRGDRIYPGADDNCSGSVALLEIGHVLGTAATRPKRSMLFIHFSGEEIGLLGSQHYVENQVLPEGGHIVAMLNMDMVGLGDGGVTVLTPPQAPSQALTPLAEQLRLTYLTIDLAPTDLHYGNAEGNSDHWPFAEAGIPALFMVTSGDHPDYHQPGDTADKLSPEALEHGASLTLALAWRLADGGVPTHRASVPITDHRRYHAHAEEM